MTASRLCRRGLCWCLVVLAVALGRSAYAQGASALGLRWGPLRQLAVVSTTEGAGLTASSLRPATPDSAVALTPADLLLVPVRGGDTLHVSGSEHQWGLGFGQNGVPDAITWDPNRSAEQTIGVPSWGAARFVVVRVSRAGPVRVEIAERVADPLALVRRDDRVRSWLRSAQSVVPIEFEGAERAMLSALGVVRDQVRTSFVGLAHADRVQAHEALGEILLAQWLTEQYAERPLSAPFFIPSRLTVSATPRSAVEDEAGLVWFELAQGESLQWDPGEADIVEFSIATEAVHPTHFVLEQGAQRIEREQIAVRKPMDGRFRPPQNVRFVLHSAEALRLVASSGALRVAVRGFSAEEALEALRARRSVRRLLARAEQRTATSWSALHAALNAVSQHRPLQVAPATLKPGQAAAIAALRLPRAAGSAPPLSALRTFWEQSQALPERARRTLLVWVLWKVNRGPLFDSPEAVAWREAILPTLRAAADDSDSAAQARNALLDSVVPPVGGGRSTSAANLEANRGVRDRWPGLLEASWRRAAPWVTQVPAAGARSVLDWQQPEPLEPGADCLVQGPEGLRWSVIGRSPIAFDAAPVWGTHHVIRFQPLPLSSEPQPIRGAQLPADSLVVVDDQRFSVLPLLGVGSAVAIRAGQHRASVAQGDPVLAQLPRTGPVPCGQLRVAERWAELDASVEFELPAGDVPTVASVAFEPRVVGPEAWPARVVLVLGSKRYEAVFYNAETTVEVPVPPRVTRLALHSDKPARVRVRARQQRTRSRADASDQSVPPIVPRAQLAPASQPVSQPAQDNSASATTALERLRQLGQQLARATTPEQVAQLREERAVLLNKLGYRRLADMDLHRRAEVIGIPTSTLDTDAALSRSVGPAVRNEAWLPQRPEPVLGVDRASALTPLDDDVAPQVLQDSYAEIRRGAVGQARERLLAAGAEQQAGRAALALAYGFETEGDFARAAAIYERVTQRTNDSNVLARHVIALTNTALFTGDRAILTRAHWLARRAVEKGARAAPLLGPIAPYVEWDSPTLSALGFGGARVAQRGEPDEVVTDVTQLRAALLDKPPLARWFSAETSSSLVESPSQLAVTSLCFDRQGAREGCRFEPEIDGARVSCLPAAQVEVASPNDDVARPHRCQFMVPRGARRLRWVTNGGDPLGWLLLEAPDTAGSWQSLPQTLSYTETTPNVPLLLDLAGPAVLRVTARGKPGATGRVEVRVFGAGDHPVGEARVLELPSAADPGAQRLDVPTPLGRSVSGIVLIEGKGQHRVSIASNSSEVLIRPELARVRTPDVIAQPPAPIMANAEAVVNQEGAFALELPRVGPRATPGGVTVSADLALVDQVKTEEAVHEVRTEAGVTVRKALIEDQLWVRTELQGRLRGGPPSAALEAYVSWAARETSPGFFALVRATMQERAGERFFETPEELGGGSVSERRTGVGLGYFASFGASHSLPLSERLSLLPSVAAIFREADNSVRGMRGVDSQVYSYYSWIHPRSWDAQLSLIYRMRYDSVLQSALQVRLNPDLDGVDNWQGALIWKWLGGAGYWPWISWQTQLTWYEQSALRELAFARLHTSPAATFWRWLGNGDRVRATLACGAQWDEPSPDFVQPALFASIGVGYDFSAEQGLRDFVPFERPFRRRLEEGSKRQTTRSTGSNPYWGWEPAP